MVPIFIAGIKIVPIGLMIHYSSDDKNTTTKAGALPLPASYMNFETLLTAIASG